MSIDEVKERASLLPCPFCGKQPSHVECMDIGMLGIEHKYVVLCYCDARGPESIGTRPKSVERKAARLWNARAAQPVRVSREALENALLTVADPDEKHLTKEVADMFTPVLRALNIEVTDK